MCKNLPPVLALHGNLGCVSDWDAWDLPWMRKLDLWDYAGLSLDEMADALAAMAGEPGDGLATKPVLLGYSLGGRLALNAMARHPDSWRGAVILSAHPGLPDPEERLARIVADAKWAREALAADWDVFLQNWNRQTVLSGSSASASQADLKSRRQQVADAFTHWSLGRQADLRHPLQAFHSPVLWLTGEEDEKFTALARDMKQVFSRFRQEVIPGTGHRLIHDPRVMERVKTFLAEGMA